MPGWAQYFLRSQPERIMHVPFPRKIPTHAREQNVKRKNHPFTNIGA
jgi:hypothetical protein